MAPCAPTTSLLTRAISSAALLFVKKRSDCRWRWSNTARRRSKMIPSPIWELTYRWSTPIRPLTSGTSTIPAASRLSCPRSRFGSASSISARIKSGGTSVRPVIARIVSSISTIRPTYGRAYAATRRSTERSIDCCAPAHPGGCTTTSPTDHACRTCPTCAGKKYSRCVPNPAKLATGDLLESQT